MTGDLHLGHALNGSIQDVLIRWHRMQGYRTLWQPGYDHAGISTQNVVEKQLAAEGLTRHDLGREAFIERTWEWLEQTGRTIMGQYRRLGASLDYSRERFTLDDGYSRAVTEFFVRLWNRGWIYRANRIVNWCPFHQTAISDLEVEHVEMDDVLTYVRYPFADGDGSDGIVIATVRPATILGDVAVAVHPDDERYRDAVGREVVVPYVEPRRAGDRRRARRAVVRLRRAQDHARPRPARLRDRPRPRAARADGDRARRQDERPGRRPRGPDAGGGRRRRHRLDQGARPARQARELPALRRHLRALPLAHRAADLAPVVVRDGGARGAGDRRAPRAARALPPRVAAPVRDRLARGDPGLVPLAAALVGSPAPDLDDARRRGDLRRHRGGGAGARRRGRRADARPGRARHLVLVGALAVRDARLAGADARARGVLPGQRQLDGARDHPALGEPHDLGGPRADGRGAVHRRDHPLDRARGRRPPDVEEPRHGRRPARDDRRPRRRRDALRAAQDLLDPGRPLLARGDRGGPQAREQALERLPPDPAERRRRRAGSRADRARGALDPGPDRPGARAGRGGVGGVRLRDRHERALPPHLRRLLRLVRRGGQAAALRARGGRVRDGARRARAPARAAAPGHAARDRGDLVAPAGRAEAADRVGVAGAGRPLSRRERRARPRAGGRGDVPAQRRPGRARLRGRAAGLRRRRPAGAAEGAAATPARRSRACRRRSRAPSRCSRTSGSSSSAPRRGRRRRARASSSASGASSRRSTGTRGAEARPCGRRRVAVLADVHGNAVALAAVLAELEREQPDAIVHCGDLTWGPLPAGDGRPARGARRAASSAATPIGR